MDSIANPAPAANRITGVGVLDRSVLLLELLADGPRPLRWLSEHSRLPRPTAHRLLVALEAHGLVGRDAAGAFRPGTRAPDCATPSRSARCCRWPRARAARSSWPGRRTPPGSRRQPGRGCPP